MQVPRTPWSIPFPATLSTWLLSPRSQDGNHTSSEHAHVLRKVIREGLTRDFHSHFFGQNYTSCTTLAVKAAGQLSNFVFSLSGVKKDKGGRLELVLIEPIYHTCHRQLKEQHKTMSKTVWWIFRYKYSNISLQSPCKFYFGVWGDLPIWHSDAQSFRQL